MKSSSITYPESHYSVARQCCLDIVDSNFCAAKLLDFFISWHDLKKNNQSRDEKEKAIVKQHDHDVYPGNLLLQYHTSEDLIKGLIGEYTQDNIAVAIRILEQKGFISIHPSPRQQSGRIEHFLVCPGKIQIALKHWEQSTQSTDLVNQSRIANHNVTTAANNINRAIVVPTNHLIPTTSSNPQANITATPGKKLDLYGPDRKDAPAVNWGIDHHLWQTKQELTQFRIALIAYLPLVTKYKWISEPIPYVRQTIKKATEGDNEAEALLVECWNQYEPGVGITLPQAPWLSLDERQQQRYINWINNDVRWNWQRENIPGWINKSLNEPESKPCKDMWENWLIDRQADTKREALLLKEQQARDQRQAEIDSFTPLTAEESAVVVAKIQDLKERYTNAQIQQRTTMIERSTEINTLLGIAE